MPKSAKGFVVWFIATIYTVYSFSLNTAASVFIPAIKTSLTLTNLDASLATGAFILGFACMQLPAGYLLVKSNTRYVVCAGILCLTLGNIATAYSYNLTQFILANIIQGAGASFSFISVGVLISQWFPENMFPILIGLTQSFSCLSAAIIHYIFSIELETHTWNQIYGMLGAFGTGLFVLAVLFIRSPPGYEIKAPLSFYHTLKLVVRNKQIWLCSLSAAMSLGVLLAYASFWYMEVQHYYAVEHLQSVVISGFIFVGIAVGSPTFAYLSNYIKTRTWVIHITLILGTMGLLLSIYLPHYQGYNLIIIKIVSFLTGFFMTGSMLFYTMINEIATDKTRGVALSIINTSVFLFNTLLFFIPYLFVTALSKDFFTYLWVLPFFSMLALLLLDFIKDTHPT